jgi:hypothetical protein
MEFLASATAKGLSSMRRLTLLREASLRRKLHKQYFALTRGWGF